MPECQASQAALAVTNLPGSAGDIETRLRSLGQEGALEEGMATHSSILAWRLPYSPGGHTESGMTEAT